MNNNLTSPILYSFFLYRWVILLLLCLSFLVSSTPFLVKGEGDIEVWEIVQKNKWKIGFVEDKEGLFCGG